MPGNEATSSQVNTVMRARACMSTSSCVDKPGCMLTDAEGGKILLHGLSVQRVYVGMLSALSCVK